MTRANHHRGRTIRNIVIFCAGVIALGWLGRWLDLRGGPPAEGRGGMALWILSPLLVSLLLRGFAGDGWADLGVRPRLRRNASWYAVSALAYPILAGLVLLVGHLSGALRFAGPGGGPAAGGPSSSAGVPDLLLQSFALLLLPQLLTNVAEESGFRGYLAPKLTALGLPALASHVIVGIVWGVWHLPYLRAITPYTSEAFATLAPRFIAGTIAASVVYGEIRLLSRSVWPAIVMQTIGGCFIGALLLNGLAAVPQSNRAFFLPTLEGWFLMLLFAGAGLAIHELRVRRGWPTEAGAATQGRPPRNGGSS
jgi:membrane protease YdiL (CAAX protease family)